MDRKEHLRRIREYKPTPEAIARHFQWRADYDAYLLSDDHGADCHCTRCMAEFFASRGKR